MTFFFWRRAQSSREERAMLSFFRLGYRSAPPIAGNQFLLPLLLPVVFFPWMACESGTLFFFFV